MISLYQTPKTILFDPAKHHLGFIRGFFKIRSEVESITEIIEVLRK